MLKLIEKILFLLFFPGIAIYSYFSHRNDTKSTIIAGSAITILIVSYLTYFIALNLDIFISIPLICLVFFFLSAVFFRYSRPFRISRNDAVFFIILFLFFIFSYLNFNQSHFELTDCAQNYFIKTFPSDIKYSINIPVDMEDSFFLFRSGTGFFSNFRDKDFSDEEIGTPFITSTFYALLGLNALPFSYAIINTFIFSLFFLISKKLLLKSNLSYLASALLVFNPLFVSERYLNPSSTGLFILLLVLYLLIVDYNPILAGIFYGILGSVRPISLFFFPAIILWIYFNKGFTRNIFYFIVFGTMMLMPVLLWRYLRYDSLFIFGGFFGMPQMPHHFFVDFYYPGYLNFPFHTHVVRSMGFPYPMFIFLPFVVAHSFGLILICMALFGIYHIYHKDKNMFFFFLLFFLPYYLLLSFQENWMIHKTTLLYLIYPIIIIWACYGLISMNLRKFFALCVILSFMLIMYNAVSFLEFPVDTRIDFKDIEIFKSDTYYRSLLLKPVMLPSITSRFLMPEYPNLDINEPYTASIWPGNIFDVYKSCLDKEEFVVINPRIKKTDQGFLFYPFQKSQSDNLSFEIVNLTGKNFIFVGPRSSPDSCYKFNFTVLRDRDKVSIDLDLFSAFSEENGPDAYLILLERGEHFFSISAQNITLYRGVLSNTFDYNIS